MRPRDNAIRIWWHDQLIVQIDDSTPPASSIPSMRSCNTIAFFCLLYLQHRYILQYYSDFMTSFRFPSSLAQVPVRAQRLLLRGPRLGRRQAGLQPHRHAQGGRQEGGMRMKGRRRIWLRTQLIIKKNIQFRRGKWDDFLCLLFKGNTGREIS